MNKYKTQIAGRTIYFKSFDAGQMYCSRYYKQTGVIVGLYEVGQKV